MRDTGHPKRGLFLGCQSCLSHILVLCWLLQGSCYTECLHQRTFLRLLEAVQLQRQSTDVLHEPHTRTCQLVWLRLSRDPLVGKAQAQRGLNASQAGIVFLRQSVTLQSQCLDPAQVCTRYVVFVGHGQQCYYPVITTKNGEVEVTILPARLSNEDENPNQNANRPRLPKRC